MIDVIAVIARWFQLAANLVLLGSCIFLTITNIDLEKRSYIYVWIERLERFFPWLAVSIPIGLLITLATTLVQVTGNIDNVLQQEIWLNFLNETYVGQIWVWRIALAVLLLLLVIYLSKPPRTRWRYILCAIVAMMPLTAGALASHSAAEELSITAFMPYVFHLIFAGIWFGALPGFLLVFYENCKNDSDTKNSLRFRIITRFSTIALPVMIMIILTGIIVSERMFDDHYAALVATPYGLMLVTKIFVLSIILLIASRVRSYWLPLLISKHQNVADTYIKENITKWVSIEFALALLLVLLATLIANTTPAKHALIENWPLPFRFSIDATWNQPNVAVQVWIGLAMIISAVFILKLGQFFSWKWKHLISIPTVLFVAGLAVALPPLTIQAYPETYRRPPVPFDVISVANGAAIYAKYCVECHGHQGMGNGIKSRTLTTKLPDFLTEPHITEHTPGDFYNWISYGMANTDMPGYAENLSDEDRWDLVNFVHALSRGYQARILTPQIIPDKAYVKPPTFSFTGHDGSPGILQDFRGKKIVLLVIFSWPQSKDRIEQLKITYRRFHDQNIAILGVPTKELDADEFAQVTNELPFPVVTQNASEIVNSYSLSRRTLSHPDVIGRGVVPSHMEFLIDKNGYLRARWIPSLDKSGWSDIDKLIQQVSLLNREQMKISFPEDYVR